MTLRITLLLGITVAAAPSLTAQSVLDRTPNLSGDWTGVAGSLHFNFLHRFTASDAPARKVSSSPTLFLAAGITPRTLIGFSYSSNSILTSSYPNEWEFFGRFAPLTQNRESPIDLGAQAGYNLAAKGFDGEISVGRREGPVRLLVAGRFLTKPVGSGTDAAVATGAVVRFSHYIALSADAGTLIEREPGEKVAWGVGLQMAIPHSPHSLSLHLTNANNATLQGESRGTDQTRLGFEFTIPVTLSRYFGSGHQPTAAPSPPPVAPREPQAKLTTDTVRVEIVDFQFQPGRIEVAAGTTVVWNNTGQLAHSVTADNGSFDTGLIEVGQRRALKFDTQGTFTFHCTPHPFMTGTVVVR